MLRDEKISSKKKTEKIEKTLPGYLGVSQWMDAVVARAKAARASHGARSDASTDVLAAAARAAGAEPRIPMEKNATVSDASTAPVPLRSPARTPEAVARASPTELRRLIDDQRNATRALSAECVALREMNATLSAQNEKSRKAREETADILAKALAREETFEEELRKASERCSETERGRRSARAALAEMASQNARLVTAFAAKKEEARTLRVEIERLRAGEESKTSGSRETARSLRDDAEALREALRSETESLSAVRFELAESKLEIERLRDTIAAAALREARGDGDAEIAGMKAREESLAARVSRKELEVERARFATERERWDSERKRWASEIASMRATASNASNASKAKTETSSSSSTSRCTGAPFSRFDFKPSGVPPNAAFKDPFVKPGTSRSQPSSPTKRSDEKALSPLRQAPSCTAHGARSAPSSPSRGPRSSKSASGLRGSPGPSASPRSRAEHHKVRGNNEFHARRYENAVTQYSSGLDELFEDDALRAILHANRAAAYQALKRYCDAVMDCCISNHLDKTYLRALQRRADAYLSMGDWPNAAKDLAALAPSMGPECGLKLDEARRKAEKGVSIDHYAVLGVSTTATSEEIKKAYRKCALKHHPDKAPRASIPARSAAEALFKHVAHAYAVLGDPGSRRKYDASVMTARRGYY
jgi:DnaJ family protein C protein 7